MDAVKLVMMGAWLITALASLHTGIRALGYDLCEPWHQYEKYTDIVIGIAGGISLWLFFTMGQG